MFCVDVFCSRLLVWSGASYAPADADADADAEVAPDEFLAFITCGRVLDMRTE